MVKETEKFDLERRVRSTGFAHFWSVPEGDIGCLFALAETCQGFIPTCQCQEALNVSFGNQPEMGKACGPNSPFSVKLFYLFDHFITPWELKVLT